VFLVFWMLITAIMQYGYVLYLRQLAQSAARVGARLASTAQTHDVGGFNYQTDATVKTAVFNQINMVPLFNNTNTASFTSNNVIVNAVTMGPPMTAVAGNTNNGAWINSVNFGNAIAVQIDARYRPFMSFFFHANVVPIQAVAAMRCEGDQ
jgi:Flp pilus assembly protein TadG